MWIALSVTLGALAVLVIFLTREKPPSSPKPSAKRPESGETARRRKAQVAEAPRPAPAEEPDASADGPASKQPDSTQLVKLEFEEDESIDPTRIGKGAVTAEMPVETPTKRIVFDEDAEVEEPTQSAALILLSAGAQTDSGLRRKRNEDSILTLAAEGVYAVADGMGGYKGGEIASSLAVQTIERAFREKSFAGPSHASLPSRASELARSVQMANRAILEHAQGDKQLEGMGTTICAVRFAPNKQRVYVVHVGDSRVYRLRGGEIRQLTSDHTMKDFGVQGPGASHLSRAVGIWPTVMVDVLIGKPRPGDTYLLCSDGLTKMVSDATIAEIVAAKAAPAELVEALIAAANERGGKDNISVIAIRVVNAVEDARARAGLTPE